MSFSLPKFIKGKAPTLLTAALANKVKGFIDAWLNAEIKETSGAPRLDITQAKAVLYLRKIPKGYKEKDIVICEDGVETTYTFLIKTKD